MREGAGEEEEKKKKKEEEENGGGRRRRVVMNTEFVSTTLWLIIHPGSEPWRAAPGGACCPLVNVKFSPDKNGGN